MRADVVPSESTARVAADAGLFSSCARPAASVPRATRASRSRACVSTRRTVPTYPRMKCTPNANHSPASAPRALGLQREHPPVAVAAPGGEVARRASSHAANPPAQCPGRGQPAHHGVLGADVPQQGDRPLQEHPPEDRRLALVPELLALAEGADLALPGQPGQLVVGQGVEQRYAAQLRRVHRSLHQVRREVAVDEVDGHRAFADRRRDAASSSPAARRRRRRRPARSSPARTGPGTACCPRERAGRGRSRRTPCRPARPRRPASRYAGRRR